MVYSFVANFGVDKILLKSMVPSSIEGWMAQKMGHGGDGSKGDEGSI